MRRALATILLLGGSIPLVAAGAMGALTSASNDPRQWLPRRFAETDKYDWFQQHFGADEISVVSWPGCTLDDPRVERLAHSLEISPFFDRATTGPRVLEKLTAAEPRASFAAAVQRLRGFLIGSDGRTTCVVLATSAAGMADRSAAVREIARRAAADCSLEAEMLRLAGPTVDAAAIDVESRRLLFQLAGISAMLSFLVASSQLKSIRLAVIVLASAVYSTALALAIVHFSGGRMNLLMTMLPPLVYVLSVSASVHLANYYRDAAGNPSLEDPVATAVGHGWPPCLLAALTTAVGLVSLMVSEIDPIRMFGLYSAVGALVVVAVLFLFMPAALRLFPPAANQPKRLPPSRRGPIHRVGGRLMEGIVRHHAAVMISCLVLMGGLGWGLQRVKSTVRLQDRFLSSSKILRDYRWLEEHVGPMVPLEVVIRCGQTGSRDFLEQMQLVAAIQQDIESAPQTVATMSAADLAPPIPQGGGVNQAIRRRIMNRRLFDGRQSLVDARFLAEDKSPASLAHQRSRRGPWRDGLRTFY